MWPLKATRLLAHLLVGLVLAFGIALADALGQGGHVPRERLARWWHRALLRVLRVRVHVRGAPLLGRHLTVANHVSWLDIPVLGAQEPTRFLARHDLQDWPIAGRFADACGTLYIRRGKGGARAALQRLVPHLADRGSVIVFPEGTTSDGRGVLPFHARLFEAALRAGVSVQPVALRYAAGADGRALAPFVGEDTLVGHVLRVLRAPELHVEVRYGAALVADAATTRDGLAEQAQRWVAGVVARGEFLPAVGSAPQAIRPRAVAGEPYQ